MAHRIQLIAGAGALLLAAACGLSVVGEEPIGGLDASVPLVDGGSTGEASSTADARPPPPPADCSKATCDRLALAAPGFTQIAFGDAVDSCPIGFDSADTFEGPNPGAGSCTCGACVTTGTTCTTGKVQSKWSDLAEMCNKNGDANDLVSGECQEPVFTGNWIGTYASEVPPPPKLGSCTAPGVAVPANANAKADRVCTRHADTCAAAMCSLPGKLEICLVAPGEVDCPKDVTERHVIGAGIDMKCDDCTCNATAVCGGTMSWWRTDGHCSGTATGTVPANACVKVDGASISSYRWDGTVASEGCSPPKPASKATAALTGVQTVCCPKH